MKRYILILALVAVMLLPSVVIASDTDDAVWRGTIKVTNNSTATSAVATVFTCNITAMVDAGYMNLSANDTAVISAAGADLAYQPPGGADNTTWCLWVRNIGSYASLNDILYTGGPTDMDSTLAYFPTSDGMAVDDDDTLEISDNGSVSQSGWINTDDNEIVFVKPESSGIQTQDDGYIYGGLWETIGVTPDDDDDHAGANITYILLDNPATYYGYLDTVKIYADNSLTGARVGTFYLVSGTDYKCRDSADIGAVTSGAVRTFTDLRIQYEVGDYLGLYYATGYMEENTSGGGGYYKATDEHIDPGDQATYSLQSGYDLSISASGFGGLKYEASSDEYDITMAFDGTNMDLYIDGSSEDTTALAGDSADNTTDAWQFGSDATPYIISANVTVAGVCTGSWEWEYGATFTDLSGNGNTATPAAFRSTTSDADVTAELLDFMPISEADAPDYVLNDAPDYYETTPGVTGDFSVSTSGSTYPGHDVITAIAIAGQVPEQLPVILIASFALIVASVIASAILRSYGSGALVIKSGIIAAIMCIYVALGVYQVWQVYFFVIMALGIMWMSRQREAY